VIFGQNNILQNLPYHQTLWWFHWFYWVVDLHVSSGQKS